MKGSALLLLFTVGCSVDVMDGTDGTDGSENIGTTSEAVLPRVPGYPVLPDAYGIDKNDNRCWTNFATQKWGGGACRLPSTKTGWTVYVPNSSDLKGCFGSTVTSAIQRAANDFAGFVNSRGWGVTVVAGKEPGGDRKFAIKCDNRIITKNGRTTLGATFLPTSCSSSDTASCFSSPYGTAILYKDIVDIRLYIAAMDRPNFNFIYNVALHELGHAFGLGHDTPAESCLMMPDIRDPSTCVSPYSTLRQPSALEFDMLAEYGILG